MCVHRLYIFLDCGPTTYAPSPLRLCAAAARDQQPSNAPYPSADQLNPQAHTQIQSPSHSPPPPSCLPSPPPPTHHNTLTTTTTTPSQSSSAPSLQRACPPTAHPYHTLTLHTLALHTLALHTLALHTTCLPCQRHRAALLAALEDDAPGVRVEGWKWRVRYVPRGRENAYAESETETMGEVMGEVGRVGYGGGR